MPFPDLAESTLWTRLMAATITFIVLAGSAAAVVVFAMLMVLFSADGGSGSQFNNALLTRATWGVALSLGVALVMPPLMILCKASPVHSLVPAGVGFVGAGSVTLWFVIVNLGGQTGG